MGFGVSLMSFSAATLMKSADVNSNFTNLNNAMTMTNGTATWCTYAANLQTNGGTLAATVDGTGQVAFSNNRPVDSNGNGFEPWAFSSGFNTGTFNHGYGGTPNFVDPSVNSFGNAEGLGIDTIGATTFHLNMPTAFSWNCQSSLIA